VTIATKVTVRNSGANISTSHTEDTLTETRRLQFIQLETRASSFAGLQPDAYIILRLTSEISC